MKTVKFITAIMLAFMVTASFAAQDVVKSKLGDIELTKDNGETVCTAGFNDELKILKNAETKVLVKGKCGQGWVEKFKVEYIAKAKDNNIILGEYKLPGWTDLPTATGILYDDVNDVAETIINRNFEEYLTYTMDREQTEIRNGEN